MEQRQDHQDAQQEGLQIPSVPFRPLVPVAALVEGTAQSQSVLAVQLADHRPHAKERLTVVSGYVVRTDHQAVRLTQVAARRPESVTIVFRPRKPEYSTLVGQNW